MDDLFYESQPTELPWIRTECVIDVVQAAAYLGQAVVFLYKVPGGLHGWCGVVRGNGDVWGIRVRTTRDEITITTSDAPCRGKWVFQGL